MEIVSVDTGRIKLIRKGRKMGRPKLAKLSGLTERQLAKLESASETAVDINVLYRLSDALQVPTPTLTGEFDMVAEDLEPVKAQTCTNGCCS